MSDDLHPLRALSLFKAITDEDLDVLDIAGNESVICYIGSNSHITFELVSSLGLVTAESTLLIGRLLLPLLTTRQ